MIYLCQLTPYTDDDGETLNGPDVAFSVGNIGNAESVEYFPNTGWGLARVVWAAPYTPSGEYLEVYDGATYVGDAAVDAYSGFAFDTAWVKAKCTELGIRP